MTAIRMSYANIKTVPSRKVYQAVFEGPIEQMMEFMALFGAPNPHESTWAGIARLRDAAQQEATAVEQVDDRPARPLSQMAAFMCTRVPFRRFLEEKVGETISGDEEAAIHVRRICGIASRRELDSNEIAARHWRNLKADYDLWMDDVAPDANAARAA